MSICATVGCESATAGKSKYCAPHRTQARAAWRERIAGGSTERDTRQDRWAALFEAAEAAGKAAGRACTPAPMTVVQHASPLDDSSPVIKRYAPEPDGVCGFASVVIRPGNCSFALWLKKNSRWVHPAYHGGVEYPIHAYQQSYERKVAHAAAFAKVLTDAGIEAYVKSDLD